MDTLLSSDPKVDVGALHDEIHRLSTALNAALAVLRKVEWRGYASHFGGTLPACPVCHRLIRSAHREGCELAAAISATPPTDSTT